MARGRGQLSTRDNFCPCKQIMSAARPSSETQGFNGDGKGETGSGKKVGGGEGKGKRKGEALGSFSIQIISRSITFLSRYWPHF